MLNSIQPPVGPTSADSTPHSFSRQPHFPFGEELKIRLWAGLTFALLWFLKVTTRRCYVGTDDLFARWERGEQVILAFWHSRIVLMRFGYRGQKGLYYE